MGPIMHAMKTVAANGLEDRETVVNQGLFPMTISEEEIN
jgi:hypothetical protein